MIRARHAATIFAALAHGAYAVADRLTNPLAAHLLHDAARYDTWARSILEGRAFETGAVSQAPLYPHAVAAVYALGAPRPATVVTVQVALGVATVALVGRTAARAFDEEAGGWAAWLAALYGVLAFFETKLLPAALVVFLVALFVERAQAADAADRPRGWIGAGAVAGLLAAGHSASLLLLPLTAVWIALDRARPLRERAARGALCVLAAAAVLFPVAARNHAAGGWWTLGATNGGITFWQANNPGAVGVYSTPEGFSGSIASQRDESRRLAEAEEGRPLDDGEVSRHWFAKGRAFLAAHPGHAAWLTGRKLLLAVASPEQPLEYSPRLDTNPVRWLMPLPFAAFFALAIAGVVPARRRRAAQPALLSSAATCAVMIVFYVASRYRLPAIPGLAVIAGAGAAEIARRVRMRQGVLEMGAAVAVAAAVSLAWFPSTQAWLAREQDAMTLCDLGTAQREAALFDDAISSYRRAIALSPGYPYAHLDLGKTFARAGRAEEAEAETREAIRLAPELAEAHFDLGVLLFESARLDEATTCFGEAFRLSPGNADAGNNLAGTLLKLGRIERARTTIRGMRARGLEIDPSLAHALRE